MKNKYYLLIMIFSFFQILGCKKDAPQTLEQVVVKPSSDQLIAYGLGSTLTAEKSLNKTYDYYFDQFDGSQYQTVNCGPTVTTMALKWADSAFSNKPVDARNTIPEAGGWWYTSDINTYLAMDNINFSTVQFTASNADQVIRNSIDNNNLVILCLDMYYVLYNPIATQHTNKFYVTHTTGWGHFLLVKGYKQVDEKLYFEIYDPNTDHETYQDNSPKGKDRYYLDTTIETATNIWWPYAIIIAPKGQQVAGKTGLTTSSLTAIPHAKGR